MAGIAAVALDAEGRLIAAGNAGGITVARYLTQQAPDVLRQSLGIRRGKCAERSISRKKSVSSMPGETSTRRNFGAWNLVSRWPGKLKLLARRQQSFQRCMLSNNAHKLVAIPVVDIDRA
jgi:hypothetical protein